jgi:hypothetical protein
MRFEDSWDDIYGFSGCRETQGCPEEIRELPKKIAFAGKTWFYPRLMIFYAECKMKKIIVNKEEKGRPMGVHLHSCQKMSLRKRHRRRLGTS